MLQLLLFVVAVTGIGWLIGAINRPGRWYAGLVKPSFVPPNWVFPVAWTLLYVMIAVAGSRTFGGEPWGTAMVLWIVQLALNFAWSPAMFTMHRIGLALAILVCLFVTVAGYVAVETSTDGIAVALFAPYAVWVAFAGVLNAAIWSRNRSGGVIPLRAE